MQASPNGEQTAPAAVEDGKNISMPLSPRDQACVWPIKIDSKSQYREIRYKGDRARGWGPGYTRHASGCLALLYIVLGRLHEC